MPVHGLEKAIMFAQGGMRLAHFAATKKRGGLLRSTQMVTAPEVQSWQAADIMILPAAAQR